MGSASVDSTNYVAEIFPSLGEKNHIFLEYVKFFILSLFFKQYNNYLHSIYIVLGIISNLMTKYTEGYE
jgi:hypothetical protein